MIYDRAEPYANRPSPTDAAHWLRNLFRNIVRDKKQRGAREKHNQYRITVSTSNLKFPCHFELFGFFCWDFKLAGERRIIKSKGGLFLPCQSCQSLTANKNIYGPLSQRLQQTPLPDILLRQFQIDANSRLLIIPVGMGMTRSEGEWAVPDGAFQIRNGKTWGIYLKTMCFYYNSKHSMPWNFGTPPPGLFLVT